MTVLSITDANFKQEVLNSDLPVLIDFYADWCQPCKRIAPIIAEIADEYAGNLKVVKVNTEFARNAAQQFQVRSIPMVALIKNGKLVEQIIGARPKSSFLAMINKIVTKPAPAKKAEFWTVDRLKSAAEIGMAIPVDLRDKAAFDESHIPEAIHFTSIKNIKKDDFIIYVLYGENAGKKAAEFMNNGHNAAILKDGINAWKLRNLPLQ